MTIRTQDTDAPIPLGDWLIPGEPAFLRTEAYRLLMRDLRRYTQGEVPGRSYLIAGHRGSGKTSMVARAIRELRADRLMNSTRQLKSVDDPSAPKRPLLVKLYGPSLVQPLPPTAAELQSKAAAKEGEGAGDPVKTDSQPDDSAGAIAAEKQAALTQAALAQITIALYRALVGEMAEGYGVHARAYGLRREGEAIELAGQMALETDTGTSPATLRSFWKRLDRLRFGVLWPRAADQQLETLGVNDQGVREIVALSTAGQAFEVCSGVVNYKVTDRKSDSQSWDVQVKGKTDLQALLARLGTLGVGVGASAALSNEGPWAAVSFGALVWLLGTISLGWTFQGKRARDRTAEYTFLRDRSLQTLDRELPLVIRRVRDAGLAPVFVLDELDKLEDPRRQIGEIVRNLKHLITDHGFFCFLADRTYFDHVERCTQAKAFPTEHTYFTERRLIAYSPAEIAEHVAGQIIAAEGDPSEAFACDVLARWITHKAKLNFTAVIREVGRFAAEGERLTASVLELPTKTDVQLAVSVQLAIDLVLADGAVARRISQDSGFAQLAHDALYAVSRQWEADARVYDASRGALETYLNARLQIATDGAGEATLGVEEPDLNLLLEAVADLIGLLVSFKSLAGQLTRSAHPLASIVPTGLGGLLSQRAGGQGFDFNFDYYGRDLRPNRGKIDQREISHLRDVIAAFQSLLASLGLTVEHLTAARLLPQTLSTTALRESDQTLAGWAPAAFLDKATSEAIARAQALRAALDEHGERVSASLFLARRLLRLGSQGASLAGVLEVLARYPVLGANPGEGPFALGRWKRDHPGFPALETRVPLQGEPDAIRLWTEEYATGLARPARRLAPPDKDLWAPWTSRFLGYFLDDSQEAAANPISFAELAAAVLGRSPTAELRAELGAVSRIEWSRLCLAALPSQVNPAPRPIAIVAALNALGFNGDLLRSVATAPGFSSDSPSQEEIEAAVRIASNARSGDQEGFLVILDEDVGQPALAPSSNRPILYVTNSDLRVYDIGLDWLQSLNVFTAVLYEEDSAT